MDSHGPRTLPDGVYTSLLRVSTSSSRGNNNSALNASYHSYYDDYAILANSARASMHSQNSDYLSALARSRASSFGNNNSLLNASYYDDFAVLRDSARASVHSQNLNASYHSQFDEVTVLNDAARVSVHSQAALARSQASRVSSVSSDLGRMLLNNDSNHSADERMLTNESNHSADSLNESIGRERSHSIRSREDAANDGGGRRCRGGRRAPLKKRTRLMEVDFDPAPDEKSQVRANYDLSPPGPRPLQRRATLDSDEDADVIESLIRLRSSGSRNPQEEEKSISDANFDQSPDDEPKRQRQRRGTLNKDARPSAVVAQNLSGPRANHPPPVNIFQSLMGETDDQDDGGGQEVNSCNEKAGIDRKNSYNEAMQNLADSMKRTELQARQENSYNEALQNLAESMKRTEQSRRQLLMQRSGTQQQSQRLAADPLVDRSPASAAFFSGKRGTLTEGLEESRQRLRMCMDSRVGR